MTICCAALAALLLAVPAAAQLRFTWTDLGIQTPGAREDHRMVYDEARGVVVMFGGSTPWPGNLHNDTWTFDGQSWTRQLPAHVPQPRRSHAMAYDPLRERVVMAGGRGATALLYDTWEWDGTDWTLVDASTPGVGFNACYDPVQGGVFCSNVYGQFLWDGRSWTQLGGPLPWTVGNALVFDAGLGGVLSWSGGQTFVFRPHLGWSVLASNLPDARHSAAAFSTHHQVPVLFGGVDLGHGPPQTWSWNGQGWGMVTLVEPVRRSQSALVYDPRRDVFVMYGGKIAFGGTAADTWELRITRHPASFETYGQGCAGAIGTTPTLDVDTRWNAAPVLGGLFFTRIDGAPAGQPAFGIVGTSRTQWGNTTLPYDLGPLGMSGCALLASVNVVEMPGVIDAAGSLPWILPVPTDPRFLGATFFQQAAVLAPRANTAGVIWTNGAAGTIGVR